MASNLQWKVYDKDGNLQASVRQVSIAALVVKTYGVGAKILRDGWIIYRADEKNGRTGVDDIRDILIRTHTEKAEKELRALEQQIRDQPRSAHSPEKRNA